MPGGGYGMHDSYSWNHPAWFGQNSPYENQGPPYPVRRQLSSISNIPGWYGQGGVPTINPHTFPAPSVASTFIGNPPLSVDPFQRQVPPPASNPSDADGKNGKENPGTTDSFEKILTVEV